jgi:hypothetical protein
VLKEGRGRHPPIQDVAIGVVELRSCGPTPHFMAHRHVSDTRNLNGCLEVGSIELGRVPRVWAATDVCQRLDSVLLQEHDEAVNGVIGMADRVQGGAVTVAHHAEVSVISPCAKRSLIE